MCFRPAAVMTKPNRCPECGKMNKPKVANCVDCGALLPHGDMRVDCPRCGFKNDADAEVCAGCGATKAELMAGMKGAPGAPKPPAPPAPPAPPKV